MLLKINKKTSLEVSLMLEEWLIYVFSIFILLIPVGGINLS